GTPSSFPAVCVVKLAFVMSQHPYTREPGLCPRCTCPTPVGDVADGQEGTHLLESRFINGSAPAAWRGFLFVFRRGSAGRGGLLRAGIWAIFEMGGVFHGPL